MNIKKFDKHSKILIYQIKGIKLSRSKDNSKKLYIESEENSYKH